MNPDLADYLKAREAERDQIPSERRNELAALAEVISEHRDSALIFVCTHNSRRSHMAERFAAAAAARAGIECPTYSAGTEATAFDKRALASIHGAGFLIETADPQAPNPKHRITLGATTEPTECFSKRFDDPSLPASGLVAVMVCDSANEACPTLPNADARIPLLYKDPKASDGTDRETETYRERAKEIAREMIYLFSLIER
ncbi:MAG: protein-tyrosine-phosphatase [Planctomycetota bacterium]